MKAKTIAFRGQGIWLLNKVLVPVTMCMMMFFLLSSCSKDRVAPVKKIDMEKLTTGSWKQRSLLYLNKDSAWVMKKFNGPQLSLVYIFSKDSTFVYKNTESQVITSNRWQLQNDGKQIRFINDRGDFDLFEIVSLNAGEMVLDLPSPVTIAYQESAATSAITYYGRRIVFVRP
jgi:hypothetical protein